jgi:hypothetical protein
MMDTYVEPSAFAEYKKTGKWPDGTQIVKELGLIKIGDDCDKVTFACSTPAGAGIFEDHFIGVGMMVKDSKRFPGAPGELGLLSLFRSQLRIYNDILGPRTESVSILSC